MFPGECSCILERNVYPVVVLWNVPYINVNWNKLVDHVVEVSFILTDVLPTSSSCY